VAGERKQTAFLSWHEPAYDLRRVNRVTSRPEFSAQTLSVLAALCDQPSGWQHGYALAKQTGLKSGTLYPILIRLADRGLVEACWQDEPQPGRPRRHLYRLTAAGLASATGALASAAELAAARAGTPKVRAGTRPLPGGRRSLGGAMP
jgi:DNA-binding MarR family transcriptional regulator